MKWPKFIFASIALHLLALFGLPWTMTALVQEKEQYMEVTLEAPPPETPPLPLTIIQPPPETVVLGLSLGKKMDDPAPDAETQTETPDSAPEAMAVVPIPETPITPDTNMIEQAAVKAGPNTPGVIGGHGNGGAGKGGGGPPFKVVAVPEGITWQQAEVTALAWRGRLASLNSEEDEQQIFKLADDPKYWRNEDGDSIGPFMGGDYRFDTKTTPWASADKRIISPQAQKGHWGTLFKSPGPNQRLPNIVETIPGIISHSFVVQYATAAVHASDVSVAKGQFGGHTFEVFAVPPTSTGVDWLAAQNQARARGGYLAVIRSAAENDFVFKLTFAKPGAWVSKDENIPGKPKSPKVTFDFGPWLGGYKMIDKSNRSLDQIQDPNGWRWFHFVSSPDETGISSDLITAAKWTPRITGILDGSSLSYTGSVLAIHYGKMHTDSTAAWGEMYIHLLNPSYVVEYDDQIAAK